MVDSMTLPGRDHAQHSGTRKLPSIVRPSYPDQHVPNTHKMLSRLAEEPSRTPRPCCARKAPCRGSWYQQTATIGETGLLAFCTSIKGWCNLFTCYKKGKKKIHNLLRKAEERCGWWGKAANAIGSQPKVSQHGLDAIWYRVWVLSQIRACCEFPLVNMKLIYPTVVFAGDVLVDVGRSMDQFSLATRVVYLSLQNGSMVLRSWLPTW